MKPLMCRSIGLPLAALVWCLTPAAHAELSQTPHLAVFMAAQHRFGFTIVASTRCAPTADGALVAYDADRRERVVWRATLVSNPTMVRVDSLGRWVVTIGNEYSSAREHAIVVYGPSGAVLRDFTFRELVADDELPRLTGDPDEGASGIWRVGSQIEFGHGPWKLARDIFNSDLPPAAPPPPEPAKK